MTILNSILNKIKFQFNNCLAIKNSANLMKRDFIISYFTALLYLNLFLNFNIHF